MYLFETIEEICNLEVNEAKRRMRMVGLENMLVILPGLMHTELSQMRRRLVNNILVENGRSCQVCPFPLLCIGRT